MDSGYDEDALTRHLWVRARRPGPARGPPGLRLA